MPHGFVYYPVLGTLSSETYLVHCMYYDVVCGAMCICASNALFQFFLNACILLLICFMICANLLFISMWIVLGVEFI